MTAARACGNPVSIGYARVSTSGQTLDAQLNQLRAGYSGRNIYRETIIGRRADRRELLRMLDRLTPGYVVMVMRIGQLARSTFDLLGAIKRIVARRDSIYQRSRGPTPAPGAWCWRYLAGCRMWSAILSAPAPLRAESMPRPSASTGRIRAIFIRLSVPSPEEIGASGAADHSAALEFGRLVNRRAACHRRKDREPV